jgi:hypothetical protein
MSLTASFLDENFDEVPEEKASFRFELRDEILVLTAKVGEVWSEANPFSFGALFNARTQFVSENLLKLERFVLEQPGGPYAPKFPYEQQVEHVQEYGPEELAVEIPKQNALLLTKLYHSCFPIYWQWAVTSNTCVVYDGFYGNYVANRNHDYYFATSYEKLVQEIFGVARKDTLRETRRMNVDQLCLAYMFRDILPVDVVLAVVTNAAEDSFYDFSLNRTGYQALARLTQPTVRRLMEAIIDARGSDQFMMEDALDMLGAVPDESLKRLKGVKDWLELHDRAMRLVDLGTGDSAPIKIPKELMNLAEESLESEMKLIPLMRADEFIGVGSTLDICLGKSNYFMKARRGESYCMTGLVGGEPQVAVEIENNRSKWRVLQYRGFKNSVPDGARETVQAIERFLNSSATVSV